MPHTPLFSSTAFFKGVERPDFSSAALDRAKPEGPSARTSFNDVLSSAQTRARDLAETVQQRRADEKRMEERRMEEVRARKDGGKTDQPEKADKPAETAAPETPDAPKMNGKAEPEAIQADAAPVKETAPLQAATAVEREATAKAPDQTGKTDFSEHVSDDAAVVPKQSEDGNAEDGKADALATEENAALEPGNSQTSEKTAGATQPKPEAPAGKDGETVKPVADNDLPVEKPVHTAEDQQDTQPEAGEEAVPAKAPAEKAEKAAPAETTAKADDPVETVETAETKGGSQPGDDRPAIEPAKPLEDGEPPAQPAVDNVAEAPVGTADGLAAAKEARAEVEAERHAETDLPYVAPTARGEGGAQGGGSGSGTNNGNGQSAQGAVQAATGSGSGSDAQGQAGQQHGQNSQARGHMDPAMLSGLTGSRSEAAPVSPPADFRVALQQTAPTGMDGAAKTAGDTLPPQTGNTQTAMGQMTAPQSADAAKAADQARMMMAQRQSQADATQQVAAQIRHAKTAGLDRFKIQLNPQEMGSVDIDLKVAKDGTLKALIVAEKPETLESLQRDARALEKALADAGLKANQESLEFSLRDQSKNAQQHLADGRNGRGGDGRGGLAGSDDAETEMAAGPMRRLDALVDVSI